MPSRKYSKCQNRKRILNGITKSERIWNQEKTAWAGIYRKRNKIEPELIDVLTDVYNKVILSIADEDKEVLVHLINGVLSDAEKSDEFVIKCSPQDYSYISENQGKIFCNMSKDITLDITTDETLGKNDCIIETDGAVFDCSLDKELANLTKKIKMLSCLD